MPNPPQEGFINQFLRIEIGRKDDELLERNRKFLAGGQRHVVDAFFERQNPPVEKIPGADDLPAEVIDEEHAAVGFDVERPGVEVAGAVVSQVEHVEREFAAGDDDRPLDASPTEISVGLSSTLVRVGERGVEAVAFGQVGFVGCFVKCGVEESDDAPFGVNGIGDVDVTAEVVEEPAQPLGDHRFSVAGRAVDEDGFPTANRRAEFFEQVGTNNEVLKGLAQRLGTAIGPRDGLQTTLLHVGFQRHGRGADVSTLLERLARTMSSEVGEVEAVGRRADQFARGHFDALFVFEEPQPFVDQQERQPRLSGDLDAEQIPLQVQLLENQVADLRQIQPTVGQ